MSLGLFFFFFQEWSKLSNKTGRTVPQVMVISSEGLFQAYNIDLENGGECSLMKEFASVL